MVWFDVFPDVPLRPPVIRIELNRDVTLSDYAFMTDWRTKVRKVSKFVHEVSLVGPSVNPGQRIPFILTVPRVGSNQREASFQERDHNVGGLLEV